MDDIKLAMLGNRDAAKRLTDAGVLLMQGDCLELMKDIPDGSVDMVLAAPGPSLDLTWALNHSQSPPMVWNIPTTSS